MALTSFRAHTLDNKIMYIDASASMFNAGMFKSIAYLRSFEMLVDRRGRIRSGEFRKFMGPEIKVTSYEQLVKLFTRIDDYDKLCRAIDKARAQIERSR